MNLSIKLESSELEQYLQAMPRKIFNAQRSAIRTTTTFADKEMKRRMAVATGLPASVFRVHRIRKRSSDNRGSVWLGANPVKARFAGRLQQHDFGASGGRYYWAGGFLASMHENHLSIFKRKGVKRLPIIEQVVELPMAQNVGDEVFNMTQAELQRRYIEKLEAALK